MSLIIIFTSSDIAIKYTFPRATETDNLILFSLGLFIIILTKHIEPLINLIENPTIIGRKNNEK